ncbi:MAG: hypothetical protein E6J20_01950 [Chloroflexi bacterium]|nr:MAG: hypothetical protein E6J20_01950 [Chloroflexota bacterium]
MAAYTLLQLIEVAAASAILLVGIRTHSAPVALLGGALLLAKALVNILWPEGGSVYRRSLIGYAVGGIFFIGANILVHFTG